MTEIGTMMTDIADTEITTGHVIAVAVLAAVSIRPPMTTGRGAATNQKFRNAATLETSPISKRKGKELFFNHAPNLMTTKKVTRQNHQAGQTRLETLGQLIRVQKKKKLRKN